MHRAKQTRGQQLLLEGRWHFPIALLDLDRFRRWRTSARYPDGIKSSYTDKTVHIETGLDWSIHRWYRDAADEQGEDEPPSKLDEGRGFCLDGWFYVPSTAFELEGFRDWVHSDWFPEKVKATFIDGSIEVNMSPEELESHAKLKVELVVELGRLIKRRRLGDLFTDSTTVVCPPAGVSTEPDLVFCSWESYRSGRVRPNERKEGSNRFVELVGAPDLVVEVTSASSVGKDKRRLRRSYWKAGISEYWILDARGKNVRFLLLTRGETDYVATEPDAEGYRFSPTFQHRFRVARRTNPVGRYDYRLLKRR